MRRALCLLTVAALLPACGDRPNLHALRAERIVEAPMRSRPVQLPTNPTPPAMPTPAPHAPARPSTPLPPGAPPNWLRQVRTGRSRLQSFEPFDVILDYADSSGVRTAARRVTVARLSIHTFGGEISPGIVHVTGWCHLRREVRTFSEEGMLGLRDAATGESIRRGDYRNWLLSHAGR